MTTTKENLDSLISSLYTFVQNEEVSIISDTFEHLTISVNGSLNILQNIKNLYVAFKKININEIFLQTTDSEEIDIVEIDENIDTSYSDFTWTISINKVQWFKLDDFTITAFFNEKNYKDWLKSINIFNPINEFIKYKHIQIILPMSNNTVNGHNFFISNKINENYIFSTHSNLPKNETIKEHVHVISNEQIIFNPEIYRLELIDSSDESINLLYRNYAAALSSTIVQIFYSQDKIILKGLKYLQLELSSYIPNLETIKTLEKTISWIYAENTTTRMQLFIDRLSFYEYNRVLAKLGRDASASPFDEAKAVVSDEFCKISNERNLLYLLDNHIEEAFSEAKDRYKFVITEKSDEYTKDLKDLLKDTKDKADKYSDKTRAVINSLLRDTLGSIFFLGLTAYSRFSSNKNFMLSDDANIIFILLGSYFLLSMFSQAIFNFWDISLSKSEAEKWAKSSMDYMTKESYDKYVTEPLKIRRGQLIKIQIFIIFIYIGLALVSFNVKAVSNYFSNEKSQKKIDNDINKTPKIKIKEVANG